MHGLLPRGHNRLKVNAISDHSRAESGRYTLRVDSYRYTGWFEFNDTTASPVGCCARAVWVHSLPLGIGTAHLHCSVCPPDCHPATPSGLTKLLGMSCTSTTSPSSPLIGVSRTTTLSTPPTRTYTMWQGNCTPFLSNVPGVLTCARHQTSTRLLAECRRQVFKGLAGFA